MHTLRPMWTSASDARGDRKRDGIARFERHGLLRAEWGVSDNNPSKLYTVTAAVTQVLAST